jgi:hypothetical protein
MIAYEMSFSHNGHASPMKDFKHGWKNDICINTTPLFVRGFLSRSSFLGSLKPSGKKLGL